MGQWLVDRQDVCPRRRSARHTRGANLEAGWPEWDRTPAGQSGPGRRDLNNFGQLTEHVAQIALTRQLYEQRVR